MSNHETTKRFFAVTDSKTKSTVLKAIAKHYGITPKEAEEEVTGEGAESLLDYLVGSTRTAVHVLFQRHNLIKP